MEAAIITGIFGLALWFLTQAPRMTEESRIASRLKRDLGIHEKLPSGAARAALGKQIEVDALRLVEAKALGCPDKAGADSVKAWRWEQRVAVVLLVAWAVWVVDLGVSNPSQSPLLWFTTGWVAFGGVAALVVAPLAHARRQGRERRRR